MRGTHLYLLSNERAELFNRQLVGLFDVLAKINGFDKQLAA
jgi:hypothetical protein